MPIPVPPDLVMRLAVLPGDFPVIQSIRYQVFQVEQGVAADLEFDGQDDAAQHILALWQGHAVGTARLRWVESAIAKIERVAVLKAWRGQGIGTQLMTYTLDYLGQWQATAARIHAQTAVADFYRRLGFEAEGGIFTEAGIPHVKMRKVLRYTLKN